MGLRVSSLGFSRGNGLCPAALLASSWERGGHWPAPPAPWHRASASASGKLCVCNGGCRQKDATPLLRLNATEVYDPLRPEGPTGRLQKEAIPHAARQARDAMGHRGVMDGVAARGSLRAQEPVGTSVNNAPPAVGVLVVERHLPLARLSRSLFGVSLFSK